MARATRNTKAVPAINSPPARRTRSKLKEKDAASHNNNNNNNNNPASSQPVEDAPPTTQPAPVAKKTGGKTKSSAAAKDPTVTDKSTATASKPKNSVRASKASTKNNDTASEESDNTASAPKTTNKKSKRNNTTSGESDSNASASELKKTTKRSGRQPTVDRNAKNKATKPRPRKATAKASATTKKAPEEHTEQDKTAVTPARSGPVRRTRAALKAGIASPLTPVSENLNTARKTRSKKILKDATPLSIIEDENDPKDPDDWFAEVQQEPRIYRDPGASMEEISERDDAAAAENDDIVEHDTASSDAEEAMGGDIELVTEDAEEAMGGDELVDDEIEHDGSETEEDMSEEERERPQTPEASPQKLEVPTTARSFGLGRLLLNPLTSVRKLWSRTPASQESRSPVAMSPESPTIASPSKAAQERRTSSRNARSTPREKNADKRHELSEKNRERQRISQLEAELREKEREVQELRRKSEPQELKEQTAQTGTQPPPVLVRKRCRRSSPPVIPAHRPGEKGSFGMLDEYFDLDDSNNSHAKRRRTTVQSPNDDDTDDEYDFVNLPFAHTPPSSSKHPRDDDDMSPSTLKRPRNGIRKAAIKEGLEDPMLANHELRVMHQENSFSADLFRDSRGRTKKYSPKDKRTSPSTIYNGSLMAMPGDPGYRIDNIFQKSEQHLQQQSSPDKNGKVDPAELKARAEEIVRKENSGEDITEEERQLLERAQRKFGHIAGSGSFSAPEYDSDDSSIISDVEESTSPEQNALAATSPSTKASTSEFSTKPDSMSPPPPPLPAHAQLPQSKPAAADSTVPKTSAAVPNGASQTVHNAALARQRELAEKHKPKTGSRLQYVSGVSSSPVPPSSLSAENNMESSLITQGMSTPASNDDADAFSFYDVLCDESKENYGAFEKLLNLEEKKYLSWLEKDGDEQEQKEREERDFAEYDRELKKLRAHV